MTSDLVAILEKEATAERERILGEARAKADEITAQAQREAQSYLEAQHRRLDAEQKAARTKAQSSAQLRAASLVLQTKDQAITDVFTQAEAELAQIPRNKTRYPNILRGLIKEGAAGLPGRIVIEVGSNDLELARGAVRELGLDAEVKASAEIAGGVRLATLDGRFVVENTLTSRLERVKPLLTSEVAALLWGR